VFFEGKQFFTNWPVSDILLKENNNITHDNLGILITTKENIYLPAKILLNNVSNQESGFNVFFYTPYRIDSITCKITDDLYTEVQKITSSRKNPDSKFALSFADLNKSGFYRLAIHVYYSEEKVSGTYSSYDYKFYYNR
ncbi:hypothetical protein, partial [Yoonia sp.]|uniref:hypothetical protein n=1 Tax=Yoonia sp. TaxID=2212373 RepID=UPI0025D52CB2